MVKDLSPDAVLLFNRQESAAEANFLKYNPSGSARFKMLYDEFITELPALGKKYRAQGVWIELDDFGDMENNYDKYVKVLEQTEWFCKMMNEGAGDQE